ncbi:DUF393 domain-containing protein [Rhizobium sp. NLR4a]|uniref:thiol-disulfide oxidoreductase DCC family protein n=1 Tax=Rhizobium sp. NLR4a TaxID=2731117 RepID=UPI001C83DAF9|nr:DUF393 domain-containing protein [Rhizobium sp. NLR4a]
MSWQSTKSHNARQVIVFDGVCNFCNGWVLFVSRRDDAHKFCFVAAQSNMGRSFLSSAGYVSDSIETMLLVSNTRIYAKSDAVIGILSGLGGLWRLTSLLRVVPTPLRDSFYDLIARNRYRIAGRREACAVPTDDIKERFLS